MLLCVVHTISRCVSEAWGLLKSGHTESNNMLTYFLEASCGLGLRAEALKYIPAGYNVSDCLVIQHIHALKILISEVMFVCQGEGETVNETSESHLSQIKKGRASSVSLILRIRTE